MLGREGLKGVAPVGSPGTGLRFLAEELGDQEDHGAPVRRCDLFRDLEKQQQEEELVEHNLLRKSKTGQRDVQRGIKEKKAE